jgi:hypothetical protein
MEKCSQNPKISVVTVVKNDAGKDGVLKEEFAEEPCNIHRMYFCHLHLPSNFFTLQTAKYFFADLRNYVKNIASKLKFCSRYVQNLSMIFEK